MPDDNNGGNCDGGGIWNSKLSSQFWKPKTAKK